MSAAALRANYARVRQAAGDTTHVIPMVKADAYGLGMREVVRELAGERPWGWGVATLAEGLRLRGDLGVQNRVVILAPLQEEELEPALAAGLDMSISSLDALAAVSAAAQRLRATARVHVDVDTGMGRTGFDWREADAWIPGVAEAVGEWVDWVACFTHLHSAEDDIESVHEQWSRFQGVLSAARARNGGLMVHVLNSAGTFAVPEHACDAVRPGIFLYGGKVGSAHPAPEPVVSLRARVGHVRDAVAGTSLGYGATHVASGPERWATLCIGYGDGLPRALGNRGSALLGGRRVPIIGRISMDLTVVDITGVTGVRVGDVATLLGAEGREEILLDDVAELAGTISYEILTGFTERLPRVWT